MKPHMFEWSKNGCILFVHNVELQKHSHSGFQCTEIRFTVKMLLESIPLLLETVNLKGKKSEWKSENELNWKHFYGRDETLFVSNILLIQRFHKFKKSRANISQSGSNWLGWVTVAVPLGIGVDSGLLALGFGDAFLLDRNDFYHEQKTNKENFD